MALDIDERLAELTLAEKVGLLCGAGGCSTNSVPRLSIPKLHSSDGPHGVRGGGGRFFNPPPGYLLPSATAMGATFDTKLLYRVGKLLSEEAKRKGVHVILAPTVCIQRSPLIGRGFEAFSDDPVLSGTLAAQYISGIQDHGVGSCIKHYAAHDQSIRGSQDAVVMSERTLREIHLLPFQLAFARGSSKPWSVMSSYNRINGVHCSEDPKLLNGVLRDEWGFDGLVMSDWWGTYSTSEALNAGLDLEMPGPSVFRGRALAEAVECRKVSLKAVDAAVRNLLQLINRTKAWDNSGPQAWTGTDTKESQALARKIAADSIVLLKNSKSILPLDKTKKQTYGLIGEHFLYPAVCGGGSSESEPFYISTPLEAMDEALSAGNFKYVPGHFSWRWTPLIRTGLTLPGSSDPGLLVEWFAEDPHHNPNAQAVRSEATKSTSMYFSQMAFPELPPTYFIRARSTFSSQNTGSYRFGLSVWGRAKLFVDGKKAIDQWTDHPEKTDQTPMFNKFTMERFFILSTEKGKQYSMEILLTNATGKPTVGLPGQGGVRLGGHELIDDDKAIEEAVELARNVDIPIVMVGLCSDYETEGQDRSDLHLPGRQNELVQKVAEANPNTVVVTQSGMPIQMPWLNSVTTLLHAWFGGQETGHGIVDVLFGAVNPSGRLSVTFPQCIEDTPTYLTFGKADKVLVYGEGVFVGHRYHEMVKRAPMFHFGYGLSYTRFEYSNLSAPSIFEAREDFVFKISLDIKNTGARDGDEVVQAYVADCQASVQRPVKELKAFTKAHIPVGEKRTVSFNLDKYAVSFWSEYVGKWYAEKGDFEIIIARSADPKDVVLRAAFKLADSFTWSGL